MISQFSLQDHGAIINSSAHQSRIHIKWSVSVPVIVMKWLLSRKVTNHWSSYDQELITKKLWESWSYSEFGVVIKSSIICQWFDMINKWHRCKYDYGVILNSEVRRWSCDVIMQWSNSDHKGELILTKI